MRIFYWNLDTRAVSAERYTQSDPGISSTRGDETVQVILLQGTPAAPVLADAGGTVGIVVRPAANPKQGYLAGPTALARGANAAAGYTGTTSTDTTLTRTLMHVDPVDTAAELPNFAADAVFYFAPGGGGDPVESLPFSVTILPDYYRPLDPPADSPGTGALAANSLPASVVRNYTTEATNAVNQRIAGKAASAATMAIFSAADDVAHTYTRNTALWCADLNPTSVSASTSSGWRITMVTPRHGITAHHVGVGVSTIGYWVDAYNDVYPRMVTAVQNVVGDLDLVTLDSDLPASIQPSPVLPAILPSGFQSGVGSLAGAPVITHDQNRHFCIATLAALYGTLEPTGTTVDILAMPTSGSYAAWNRNNDTAGNTAGTAGIGGDSSSPYFLLIGGVAVLLGCFYQTTGIGPDPGANAAAINAIINPQGYALTVASMPGYPVGGGDNSNTVTLSILNFSSYVVTVAGIDCAAGQTTNIGRVNPYALPFLTHGHTPWATEQFYNSGTSGSVISTAGIGTGLGQIGDGIFACPYNYPAECPDAGLVIANGSGTL